ncbi:MULTISPECIES: hypothetical protein [Pseudomonas]|uniref:hypothetical protein n=1 Tax=Pseudomonas TaxID=286 RepID=UPI00165D7F2E|nr:MULTISPECIES: hypothetical protein [Pseudomonas]
MDKFLPLLNLIGTLFLTAIINRFISSFRIRQLYLSCDDCMSCYEKEVSGCTLTLTIVNKGKDKEEKVKIRFPSVNVIQVISVSAGGVTAEGNEIFVDRVLPDETVKMVVYVDDFDFKKKASRPSIKSSDANGKVFNKRGSIPPSVGPTVRFLSFCLALFILAFYLGYTGRDPFSIYYGVRYSYLTDAGVNFKFYTDNALVSEGTKSSPTLELLPARREGSKIIFPLSIRNPFKTPIYANLSGTESTSDFWERREQLKRKGGNPDTDPEILMFRRRIWLSDWESAIGKVEKKIEPGQTAILSLERVATPDAELKNLKIDLRVDGEDNKGKVFKDHYTYVPADSPSARNIVDMIKATGN